jgi:hypothetical protein
MLFGIEELNNLVRIQKELDRVKMALSNPSKLTDIQYCEMYAIQQALSWVWDESTFASPYDLVMEEKIRLPLPDEGTTPITIS